jgi:protein-S-isoprenylcysteine O-methyltransferase Ste14
MSLKILSVAAYLAMVTGLVALLVMRSLFSPSWPVIALQIAALFLFFWARITFGRRSFHLAANPTEGGLVTTGPYRYIRHPIYTAMTLFVGAGAAAHLSWKTALVFGLVLAGALMRVYCEEILIVQRYPEYKQYASATSRMVPYVF